MRAPRVWIVISVTRGNDETPGDVRKEVSDGCQCPTATMLPSGLHEERVFAQVGPDHDRSLARCLADLLERGAKLPHPVAIAIGEVKTVDKYEIPRCMVLAYQRIEGIGAAAETLHAIRFLFRCNRLSLALDGQRLGVAPPL